MKTILDFIISLFRWWFTGKLKDDEIKVEIDPIEPLVTVKESDASAIKETEKQMITGPKDHVNATPVIKAAWQKVHGREPTTLETLYTQAIASLETGYGRIGQFANLAAQGKFNWGGMQKPVNPDGTCPEGFALGQDQGKVCFFVFDSDESAAASFIKALTLSKLRPNVIESMKGTPEDVAIAMRGTDFGKPPEQNHTAWYEGIRGTSEADRVASYANSIRNAAKSIGSATADKSTNVSPTPNGGIGSGTVGGILMALTLGGYWYSRNRGG